MTGAFVYVRALVSIPSVSELNVPISYLSNWKASVVSIKPCLFTSNLTQVFSNLSSKYFLEFYSGKSFHFIIISIDASYALSRRRISAPDRFPCLSLPAVAY